MNGFIRSHGSASLRSSVVLGMLALAACSGGGHGVPAVPQAAPASASPVPGNVAPASARLTINIPKAGVATNAADKRRPKYVSPATLSMRVVAAPSGTLTTLPPASGVNAVLAGAFDLSPTSALCTASPANSNYSRSCTLTIVVPQGPAFAGAIDLGIETYNLPVTTFASGSVYAEPNGTPPLSEGIVTSAAIMQNAANTVNVVLGGNPVGFQTGSASSISFNATNHLRQGVGAVLPLVAYDASGNIIVGPYFAPQGASVLSNTPDLSFSVNGTPVDNATAIALYGSADTLDLVYSGKGMLSGSISAYGQTANVVINNVNSIDEYDTYDNSGSSTSQMPFPGFQPEALATDSYANDNNTDIFVLSNGGGSGGKPVLADFAFGNASTQLGNTFSACYLPGTFPTNTQVGPMMVVDNQNAYIYASDGSSFSETIIVARSSLVGNATSSACTVGYASYFNNGPPVLGAAYSAYDGAIWSIDTNGNIARLTPAGSGPQTFTTFTNGNTSLPTSTVGGTLSAINNCYGCAGGIPFQAGLVWADIANQDVNVLDISDGGNGSYTYYAEAPGCGVFAQYGGASGTSAFVDINNNIDVGFSDGSIQFAQPVLPFTPGNTTGSNCPNNSASYRRARAPSAMRRTRGNAAYGANFSISGQRFFGASTSVGPTLFVDGLEDGNSALYGIYGGGQSSSNRGLVRYSSANGNMTPAVLPYFPNTASSTTYSPAGAVKGGDGRLYFLSTTAGGTYEMYAFPGRGGSNVAQAKKRAPAGKR